MALPIAPPPTMTTRRPLIACVPVAMRGRSRRRYVERDALRERQAVAVVDRVGRPAHVALPRVRSRFTAAAGVLLAAEGAADLRAGGPDVDIGDAAVASRRGEKDLGLLQVPRED